MNSEKILKQLFNSLAVCNLVRYKTPVYQEIGFVSLGNSAIKTAWILVFLLFIEIKSTIYFPSVNVELIKRLAQLMKIE